MIRMEAITMADPTSHPLAASFVGIVSVILWIAVYQPQVLFLFFCRWNPDSPNPFLTYRSFEQLYICWKSKSGDGLSVTFLIIVGPIDPLSRVDALELIGMRHGFQWLLGDITNLLGAIGQALLPTMIILASYYSLCDIALLSQLYYYRHQRATYPERFLQSDEPTEEDALLSALSPSTVEEKSTSVWSTMLKYSIGLAGLTGE